MKMCIRAKWTGGWFFTASCTRDSRKYCRRCPSRSFPAADVTRYLSLRSNYAHGPRRQNYAFDKGRPFIIFCFKIFFLVSGEIIFRDFPRVEKRRVRHELLMASHWKPTESCSNSFATELFSGTISPKLSRAPDRRGTRHKRRGRIKRNTLFSH